MAEQPRRAFVCGHPIKHSRSPKIHGYWLERYGIRGSYVAVDVAPENFPAFAAAIKAGDYVGGNVTIPHKEAAFRIVDRRDEAATLIGAVNTLWVEDGLLHGSNTDAYGFAANLDGSVPGWANGGGAAAVLGAGGAARAVLYALRQRGFAEIRLFNRTLERGQALAREFGPAVRAFPLDKVNDRISGTSLVVNTTSAGMHGEPELDIDLTRLSGSALVTDIVYVPLETPLLAAARRAGLRAVDGLGMLLHQAVPGFERWFGRRPQVTDELRELIVADLEPATA